MELRCQAFFEQLPDLFFAVCFYEPIPLVKIAFVNDTSNNVLRILFNAQIIPFKAPKKGTKRGGQAVICFILVFFHALYMGTDLKSGLLRIAWILAGIGVLYGIMRRLSRSTKID